MRNRTQHQPDLFKDDIQTGDIQLDWLQARATKVYFELLVELYNPAPNAFDWSLNPNAEQYRNLRCLLRYRKVAVKKKSYRKIRATRKYGASLPRSIQADTRPQTIAIG